MVTAMQQVDVRIAGRAYPVVIGSGLLGRLDSLIDTLPAATARRLVVSSPTIWRLHATLLPESLRTEPAILVPDGEKNTPKAKVEEKKGTNVPVTRIEVAGRYVAAAMPGAGGPKADNPNYRLLGAIVETMSLSGDRIRPFYDDAAAHMKALEDAGIDYDDVIEALIKEGVEKFVVAWDELQTTLSASLEAARS